MYSHSLRSLNDQINNERGKKNFFQPKKGYTKNN